MRKKEMETTNSMTSKTMKRNGDDEAGRSKAQKIDT
jgi:hypothetical protein